MDAPLISVIMATYYDANFHLFKQAVESVLRQTHHNLELLVAADGPLSPEANAYLEALSLREPRLRIVSLDVNQGAAAARNAAFDEARGDYIVMSDADDENLDDRLEKQLDYLKESGADIVGTCMTYVDENGEILGYKDMVATVERARKTALFLNPINNATAFARAEIFKENKYDERFRRGHDYHLYARLLVKGYTIANVPEYLYNCYSGTNYMARRNKVVFWVDLRSRFILVSLYPWYLRPMLYVLAAGLSSLRLMPRWCLSLIYRVRNSLRIAGESPNRD